MSHTVLLYYKYVDIADPEALRISQRALCEKLGLKGRIIIAKEGINGTIEGMTEATEAYIAEMEKDPRFADIHWKKSLGSGNSFPKLSVKARADIVTAQIQENDPKMGELKPNEMTGKRLSSDDLQKWFDSGKDFAIVDMRNDYEHMVGHFKGSVLPSLKNFRDLPKVLPELEPLKQKTVLSVCTGGVRCEKASGYLVKQGFQDVYQLDGGIVSYMEKYPGQNFLGSLYVFDGRVVMHFDDPKSHVVIGRCGRCHESSERYVNCKNLACHYHFICCAACSDDLGEAYCVDCAKQAQGVESLIAAGH